MAETSLASGLTVDLGDPIRRFFAEGWAYYDGIEDPDPDHITPVDVLATVSMNSFVNNAAQVREHRHRLVAVHRDEGVSGTADERDGLEEAVSAVRFNGPDGLVVHSLDRLARSLTVQEAALQQVWAAGGRVFAVDTGEVLADDPDDPVRTFVRQVLGAVSQLEAGMIARRLRRGRLHKAEAGGYAHGAPRYGWKAEGGELVLHETEQAVLDRIRGMRADGASLRDIAGVLNGEGVPSKRGGRWHPQTVARVLE